MEYLWVFLVIMSGLFFALKDVLAKKLLRKNVKPMQLVFEEYAFLLFLSLFLLFPYIDFNSFAFMWENYLMKAFSLGIFTIIYFELLKKYEISEISPLLNLSPIFLIVLSGLVLGDIITNIQLIGIIIVIISTFILEIIISNHNFIRPHKIHFDLIKQANWKFIFMVFIMIITISISFIYDSIILENVNVQTNLFFTSLLIFLILLIYYAKEGKFFKAIKFIGKEPETLIISIFMIISSFLLLYAISMPGVILALVVPLRRVSTLFSAILGGFYFHEKHIKQKLTSTVAMILGILLVVL